MGLLRHFALVVAILVCFPLASASQSGEVREFKVTAKKYSFEPAQFEVNEGDRVRLVVTATDTDHGVAIKKLKVDQMVEKGETVAVEFVASQAGTFEVQCSEWCGKGHKTMKARLLVRPRPTL